MITLDAQRTARKSYWLGVADRMDRMAGIFERLEKLLVDIEPKGKSADVIAADCRAVAAYLREEWDKP